jgi:hypothetical protein
MIPVVLNSTQLKHPLYSTQLKVIRWGPAHGRTYFVGIITYSRSDILRLRTTLDVCCSVFFYSVYRLWISFLTSRNLDFGGLSSFLLSMLQTSVTRICLPLSFNWEVMWHWTVNSLGNPTTSSSVAQRSLHISNLAKTAAWRITLNIDDTPIDSKSHTHPSHSQTSRLLTSSLSLGVPVPRTNQCMWDV